MTRMSFIYLKCFFEHFVQVFIVTLLIPLIIHLNPSPSFVPELSDCLQCWV